MKHIVPLPSLETLQKYLTYHPLTGVLSWNAGLKYAQQRAAGKAAGTMSKGGYLRTSIERRMYANNRIAWKMHHGVDPSGVVDHENGNKLDNRIENLRDTSQGKNTWNQTIRSDNTTGFKGVVFSKRGGFYHYNLRVNGVRLTRVPFETPEACNDAVMKLREELHGEFANHGRKAA